MMRQTITIMATVLLASALFASKAEAIEGTIFDGFKSGGHTGDIDVGDHRQFGRPQRHRLQPIERYPRYLPNGSCIDEWYMMGYQSPADCP
jgi:hypothetical protein